MAAVIQTIDLRKVYKIGTEKVVALDCINLTIEKGQVCCILGTSGSGKSTLLNQLAGLEKPTRGEVHIKGTKISNMTEKQLAHFRQRNIGFVFQSYNLLQGMSAVDNVALPLTFRGMGKKKRLFLAKEALKAVGLGKRMWHKPSEMSGGQQQRVGIARAFVSRPDVVFADEPTGNLDTRTTREVMDMFLGFARELQITIILVTHDQHLARYADRIVTIVDGNIIKDETNRSLYEVTKECYDKLFALAKEANWDELISLVGQYTATYGSGVVEQSFEQYVTNDQVDDEERAALMAGLEKKLSDDLWAQLVKIVGEIKPTKGAEKATANPPLVELPLPPEPPPGTEPEPDVLELIDATTEDEQQTVAATEQVEDK